MITGLLTARHLHVLSTPAGPRPVRTVEDYERAQRQWIQARQREGWPITIHVVMEPAVARVSGGNWIVDCPCRNAPLTDPEWGIALCFSCGAQYRRVRFPPDRDVIERLLAKRQSPCTRHWFPHETVNDLRAENMAHGLEVD